MSDRRPNFQDVVSNWRTSPLPFGSKLRLLLRNNFLKLRRLDSCCGNEGEPGC